MEDGWLSSPPASKKGVEEFIIEHLSSTQEEVIHPPYSMLPNKKMANTNLLYMKSTTENTTKVSMAKVMLSVCWVRKLFTRLWSLILCIKSPISFVSKNDIGSFRSLMKKSLTSEMLIRMEMRSKNHRRIKSIAVRLIVSINCPNRISQTNPMSWFLIPTSTMDWVRNGKTSCRGTARYQSQDNPENALRYFLKYLKRKRKDRFSLCLSSPSI